jgi:hypothetical protein
MIVSVRPSRDFCQDEPYSLIHGPILIHSFTDPAHVASPLYPALPRSWDNSAHPCRPRPRRSPSWDGLHSPAPLANAAPARATCPPFGLAPPVAVALHPPTVATAEVRDTDELCISDLRALQVASSSAPASSSTRMSFIHPSSKVTLR